MSVEDFFSRERVPNKDSEIGIGGFTIIANVSETSKFTSSVPTTYLEDGSFAQDHIINNPTTLEISGNISEISLQRSEFDELLERAQSTIGLIGFYIGGRTQSQIQAANGLITDISGDADRINQSLNDGAQTLEFFGLDVKNNDSQTNQELFITAMEAIHSGKQLISIDMPYRTYDNMRITSIIIARTNEGDALNYTLIASEIRFVNTISRVAEAKNPTSNLGGQTDSKNTVGTQQGDSVPPAEAQSIASASGKFVNTIAAGLLP